MKVEEQVVSIFAGVKGFLDDIDNSKIKDFEDQLLSSIKSQASDILSNIVSSGKLDEANEAKLKDFITNFKKEFLK